MRQRVLLEQAREAVPALAGVEGQVYLSGDTVATALRHRAVSLEGAMLGCKATAIGSELQLTSTERIGCTGLDLHRRWSVYMSL